MPVAKSQPGVAPYAGCQDAAVEVMVGETEHEAPDPPPPVSVQLAPPVYPWPVLVTLIAVTAPPDTVAVQVAGVPPPHRVAPPGAR
jgi:hypothetical protein